MDHPTAQGTAAEPTMTTRVRSFDWSATELGPRTAWPPELALIVDVVLANPCPMLVWWGDRGIQIYNDAARRALLGERDALGEAAADTWADMWTRLGPAVERVRAGRGAATIEDLAEAADPRRRWTVALGPIARAGGGVGGVLVTVREAASDAERAARRDAERQSEYLHSIFMQSPAPIAILRGPHHVLVLSNEAMARAWGRRANESFGRPLFEAIPHARAFQAIIDDVYATGRSHLGKEMPYRVENNPDGTQSTRFANVLYAPLRDGNGRIEGVFVIAVDITDEVRARQEMQRLRAAAEAASRAKDEFLAILGHELRNPLAPISTALQVMRLRGASGRELEVLDRQVGHLTRLVDDLLDVSRAVRGKIELHRRNIELAEVVSEALELTSSLLEHRGHLVEIDVPREGLTLHADPVRMVQIVSNLLTNAAKYSDPGSRITLRGLRTDGNVRLSVRDRGVGIAPEMLGRVFDLFVQQAQTIDRARGGLGLGLTIVRSLVELHGGTVSARSEGVGRGSEFTIELPAAVPATTRAESAAQVRAPATTSARGSRILVVDDNQDAAMTLAEALEQLGYQVAVAHDGPEALRVAAAFEPDIALLDIGLPVMDGYELAERLRAQRAPGRGPLLVAVTGYGQEADRQRTARAGFERHLVKPVSLGVLSEVVAGLASSVEPHAEPTP